MDYRHTDENFLRIDDESYYRYDDSRFVVFEAPYEYTSSYHRGSSNGPAAILHASQYVETYDEQLDCEPYRECGIATIGPLNFEGVIDAAAVERIRKRVAAILADDKVPVMLGAEHTVTLGAVQAAVAKYPDVSVLQIDAHSDLRDEYQGNRYSHASVMARVNDLEIPIGQAGIRAQSAEEAGLIRAQSRIRTWYAHQIHASVPGQWIDDLVGHLTDNVYITIDADGFDPSVIPAVGTAEPNGLSWSQGIDLLRQVCRTRRVVGFDVVEVAPVEGSTISEYALAKLVYKLIGLIVTRGGSPR